MSGDLRKKTGAAGEAAAVAYLREAGYEVIETNWRCRFGEIDIVAAGNGVLAFVEVRSRSRNSLGSFGAPLESITPKKQQTLRRCAQAYLQWHLSPPGAVRFDCIGVVLGPDGTPDSVTHIDNAF